MPIDRFKIVCVIEGLMGGCHRIHPFTRACEHLSCFLAGGLALRGADETPESLHVVLHAMVQLIEQCLLPGLGSLSFGNVASDGQLGDGAVRHFDGSGMCFHITPGPAQSQKSKLPTQLRSSADALVVRLPDLPVLWRDESQDR